LQSDQPLATVYAFTDDPGADSPAEEERKVRAKWEKLHRDAGADVPEWRESPASSEQESAVAAEGLTALSMNDQLRALIDGLGPAPTLTPPPTPTPSAAESVNEDDADIQYMAGFVRYAFLCRFYQFDEATMLNSATAINAGIDPMTRDMFTDAHADCVRMKQMLVQHQRDLIVVLDSACKSRARTGAHAAAFVSQLAECPELEVTRGAVALAPFQGARDLWTGAVVQPGMVRVTLRYSGEGKPAICAFMSDERADLLRCVHTILFFWYYVGAVLHDEMTRRGGFDIAIGEAQPFDVWCEWMELDADMNAAAWCADGDGGLIDHLVRIRDALRVTRGWIKSVV